jgi:hypothetical protein
MIDCVLSDFSSKTMIWVEKFLDVDLIKTFSQYDDDDRSDEDDLETKKRCFYRLWVDDEKMTQNDHETCAFVSDDENDLHLDVINVSFTSFKT